VLLDWARSEYRRSKADVWYVVEPTVVEMKNVQARHVECVIRARFLSASIRKWFDNYVRGETLNNLEIDGYRAKIEYDPDLDQFRGEIPGINGSANF
jgi:hypothetical protein